MNFIIQENKIITDCFVFPNDITKYRPFKYNHIILIDDGILVTNMLTGGLIHLDNYEASQYEQNKYVDKNLFKELCEKKFLVPETIDDYQISKQIIDVAKLMYSQIKPTAQYTIMTTTDCNARCFYCYEKDMKRIVMSEKMAKDVAKFIIKNSEGKNVQISWFGGEPLYNSEVIDIISSTLKEKNIRFSSRMISNAYLFDDNIVEKAKSIWHLKKVQITLDGTEKIYNKAKNYIYENCESPFLRVIRNIHLLLSKNIFVSVRLNMDSYNSNDLHKLADFLNKEFSQNEKLSMEVYVTLLYDYSIARPLEAKKKLLANFYSISNKLKDYSLYNAKNFSNILKQHSCMADNNNALLINPDGMLGKCEHFGDSDFYGNIYDGIIESNVKDWSIHKMPIEKCSDCIHYPRCIKLKKCPNAIADCDDVDIAIKTYHLENSILKMYNNFKTLQRNNKYEI